MIAFTLFPQQPSKFLRKTEVTLTATSQHSEFLVRKIPLVHNWMFCSNFSSKKERNIKIYDLWSWKKNIVFQIQVASAATCSPAKTRGQTARAAQTRSKDGFDGGSKTGSKVRAKAGSQDRFWRKTRSSNGGVPRPVCLSGVGFRWLMFRLILIASGKWKEGDTSPTGIWTSWENEEHQVWKHKSKWL